MLPKQQNELAFDKETEENIQIDTLCRLIIRSYMRENEKKPDIPTMERCITNIDGN